MDIQNEKDGSLYNKDEWVRIPTRQTTVNFSAYLHEDAKKNSIRLKDALEFGISFLIADKDGFDYPDCKLQDKLEKTVAHRNSLIQENELLRDPVDDNKVDKDLKEEIDKEVDNVFGGLS